MTHHAIVFSDPNCPFCYATEARLHDLGLEHLVRWCGVQHAPHLPAPMAPADRALAGELPAEVQAIRIRAPEVDIAVPPGKPNTELAIRYAAAALRRDPAAGRGFVRSLYRAFWTQGLDLSDPAILARLADQPGLVGLQPDEAAIALSDGWQHAWERTRLGGVPLFVRHDRKPLYGLVDSDELRAFLDPAPAA
jgi:predicted DsbA family dithiol-disulfide isomerase